MVSIGFYLLTAIALFMMLFIFGFANNRKKALNTFLFIVAIWLIYINYLSRSSLLVDLGIPPRMPLMVILPTLIASILITGLKSFRSILQNTPAWLPVYFQSFRILVELLIFGAYLNGVLPQRVTFEGLNFDIIVGISAPIIAYLYMKKKISALFLLSWNVFGLLILTLTGYAFLTAFYQYDFATISQNTEFFHIPYLLLPGVLLPLAIFLHIFSLRQAYMLTKA